MDPLNIKEKINKIRCIADRVKYSREKHFYQIVFGLLVFMAVIFSIVFINQRMDIKRKENILESYYSDSESRGIYEKFNLDTYYSNSDGSGDEVVNFADEKIKFDNDKVENLKNHAALIKVYICGQVLNPDVYEAEEGLRIVDIIDLAGGASEEACLEIINLAGEVLDGQRIYIPSREEVGENSSSFFSSDNYSNGDENNMFAASRIVNINYAGKRELESLPGIGPITAQSIIDYRGKFGLFKNKEDLKKVNGIGEKKYEKIKELIHI
jgi:competence protein ComEA